MPNILRFASIGLFAVFSYCACAGDLVIAERGKPAEYSIAIPVDAGASVKYAAEELRDYVRQITGVKLPIVRGGQDGARKAILIERKGSDELFRIHVDKGNLHITGGARGVLYGVYEILETYGGSV